MKFSDFSRGLSKIEIALLVIFIVYLAYPFQTPRFIAPLIGSPIGLMTMFVVVVFLFFYTNPLLGVLYIFVAYELIRRSALMTNTPTIIKNTPSEAKRTNDMVKMNPVKERTLEEEVIANMVPARVAPLESAMSDSSFQPVNDKLVGASLF